MKRKVGRPSLYTPELAEKICERIRKGEWLHQMGGTNGLPAEANLYKWLEKHEEFREMYARAREYRTDRLVQECVEISDNIENDTLFVESEGKDGAGAKEVCNHEWIARSRLRVDTRKWLAAKLAPKKYGDNQKLEVTGKDDGPLQAVIEIVNSGAKQNKTS